MDANPINCEVCHEDMSKYKCPNCLLKYCSVLCYKSHTAQPCRTAGQPAVTLEVDGSGQVRRTVLFPTDDTVLPDTLDKLKESRRLRALLGNPHLRALLREVDAAPNAAPAVACAMREPIFTEFADVCLSVVDPGEDDEETDSDEDL